MIDSAPVFYLATAALTLAVLSFFRKYWDTQSRPPLPPGPAPLPIVGNILSLDVARPWLTFNAWKTTHGDIIYARLFNMPIVVINSEEVASDLFDGRSNIYADKPQSFLYEAFAVDFSTPLLPYGDRWRLHRRILHQAFRQAKIPAYHPMQHHFAHKMLFSFLRDPGNYMSHIQMFSASFILAMVYDYRPEANGDHILHVMERYTNLSSENLTPGAAVVMEIFPFLLKLPSWFPGATFKRASVKCIQAGHDIKEIPFQYVKERVLTGDTGPCLVADALNSTSLGEDEIIITAVKEASSQAFAATSETTSSTLHVFILVMVLNPEVQAKAQAQIDRVVGKDRLPNFNDRPALPYVDAILRETLRWHPVVPFGVVHSTTNSDIYSGYFIPKGVLVFTNTWAMTHDETKYPRPDEFKPEKFLHEDGSLTSDTMPLGFGWGRRVCVGRHVADTSLWIAIASFLASFSAHKALDEHGRNIPVVPKFSTGIINHLEKFPCRIVPRFPNASVETLTHLTGLGLSVTIAWEFRENLHAQQQSNHDCGTNVQ